MAHAKCCRCGEEFHLRLTSEESLKELRHKEQTNEVLCLGCFKHVKVHDVVKIISENENVPEAEVGDFGVVVLEHGHGMAFEVECVLENGETKWLGAFKKEQIKWVQSPNNQKT